MDGRVGCRGGGRAFFTLRLSSFLADTWTQRGRAAATARGAGVGRRAPPSAACCVLSRCATMAAAMLVLPPPPPPMARVADLLCESQVSLHAVHSQGLQLVASKHINKDANRSAEAWSTLWQAEVDTNSTSGRHV